MDSGLAEFSTILDVFSTLSSGSLLAWILGDNIDNYLPILIKQDPRRQRGKPWVLYQEPPRLPQLIRASNCP